jgi:hypothetical protein
MKRSPDEKHTQTQESLIETSQRLQMSFLIRREQMYVNTRDR